MNQNSHSTWSENLGLVNERAHFVMREAAGRMPLPNLK